MIAVLGASGFVGSAAVRALRADGAEVRLHAGPVFGPGPGEAGARFDVADGPAVLDFLRGARCALLAAGPAGAGADRDDAAAFDCLRAHVLGTATILAAAAELRVPVVLAGSDAALPGDPRAGTTYGRAKAAVLAIAAAYAPRLPCAVVRLGNVYGPGAHPQTLLAELVTAAAAGAPIGPRDPAAPLRPIFIEAAGRALADAAQALARGAALGPASTLWLVEARAPSPIAAGRLAERVAALAARPSGSPGALDGALDEGLWASLEAARAAFPDKGT